MSYKRVLLKISGEALAGDQGFGINPDVALQIAKQINKDGKSSRRLYGHACDCYEWPCFAGYT